MAAKTTGVYPCWKNQFQIDTAASGSEASMKDIADCESFSISFDNGVEEWTPFETEGWIRRLMTAKGITFSVTAKRNVGDAGNDAVAALAEWQGHRERRPVDFPGWYESAVPEISHQCDEHRSRRFYKCSTPGI